MVAAEVFEYELNGVIGVNDDKPTHFVPAGSLKGKRVGHTFRKHGSHNTDELSREAAGTGQPVGQWVDDTAAEEFIGERLDQLASGAATFDLPAGIGRQIEPDGSFTPANKARLVPSKTGVKTAFPFAE